MSAEILPVFPEDTPWEEVQISLAALELADGLPLVSPTRARLDAMLGGVKAPERIYGHLMPLYGELTPVAVAYQCVLAGCVPAELPIVLTALVACTDEAFNLLGVATTTGTPAVATVVHGPVAIALGLNDSSNCLGPGNRANACIGRAVSLALRNIGGAKPGVGDMATMGQPGKYGFCFPESSEGILPSFAQRRGLSSDDDAVTVLGVSGTAEVLPVRQDTVEEMLTPVAAAMWGAVAASGGSRERDLLEQVFLFPPELARGAVARGWTLPMIQSFIAEARPLTLDVSVAPWEGLANRALTGEASDIHPIVTGGPGVKITHLPLWAGGTKPITLPLLDP